MIVVSFTFEEKIFVPLPPMTQTIYNSFLGAKQDGQKKFVVLIDPDKLKLSNIDRVLRLAADAKVDYIFLGGSLVVTDMMSQCIRSIREGIDVPIVLFPGDIAQINTEADAILFLKRSSLEVISTGYMLIDGGTTTTAIYMSGSLPIPSNKNDIAVCTAMAGEMLGMKLIYMDAGSGAINPIPCSMIQAVSQNIDIPLIVGGGIQTPEKALENINAGADVIVVGNAIEKNPELISEISAAVHSMNLPF
jgi:heptaprenylglyceryl phosphate synthase